MILKGSQRSGGGQLAAHLMRLDENDHVTVYELRGFVSEDLQGAFDEAHAISVATNCRQYLFSLSLNPPKDASCTLEALVDAADRAEGALGLDGQPRAIVIHEKQGRRHAHVVWSRIDAEDLKAVPLPFFKNRLAALSKELYLTHEWELPDGHRENGWKNPLNFTLAEWQQAKRLGLDPREIKQLFADSWRYSDGIKSFKAALEDRGYFLSRGDRRGFVAQDVHGEVFSVSRMVGVKTKDLEARLGSPEGLPSVEQVREFVAEQMTTELKRQLRDVRQQHRGELKPLNDERAQILEAQRREREQLRLGQEERHRRETAERQASFRKGVRALWDVLTGRAAAIRRENERAAYQAHLRDAAQREAIFMAQMVERAVVHERMTELRRLQRQELMRLGRRIVGLIVDRDRVYPPRDRGRELTL